MLCGVLRVILKRLSCELLTSNSCRGWYVVVRVEGDSYNLELQYEKGSDLKDISNILVSYLRGIGIPVWSL